VIRLYHGGLLDHSAGSLWATPDADYAAAFAQMWEGALWMLTLDVSEDEVLDLTDCGLDVAAVVTDLTFAGISARVHADDKRHPQKVLRRVPNDSIRAAGYRVVRVRDWIDWGAGERHAESVLIADLTAICDREVLTLPDRNFQFPDGRHATKRGAGLVCPHCNESRGDIVTLNENHITFRCDGCGYRWSSGKPESAEE
jgi:Zn ribbon nucleic-acid-binding protein